MATRTQRNVALLPRPRELAPGPRRLLARTANRTVGRCSERLRRAVERLPPFGLAIRFEVEGSPNATPLIDDCYDYRLAVGEVVAIRASTEWGALTALTTLAQLGAGGELDVAEVRDGPRYPWRGLMIDTVRHFISLDTLKRTLDVMAFFKLNVLHLHLTDDQGFRFRSESYPELASDDAYSAQDLRALVAYAADRAIRVVPELDVPGHATSWLVAHPEWGADGGAVVAPSTRFGVHAACLDTVDAEVLRAVDTLLGEFAQVFPDAFVHFGGDEVGRDCRAFHRHVFATLKRLGKRAIGWDECLDAQLPAETVIHAWRGIAARDAAIHAGHDCVVSSPYYLDLLYPADVHYAFDPVDATATTERALADHPGLAHVREGLDWMRAFAKFPELPPRAEGRVLGGEACLWAELVDDGLLDTRVWSRMPVIAERLWSAGEADIEDVYERMAATRGALADFGVLPEDRAVIDAYPDLVPLLEMLEPVKWYRRLLGSAEFKRRVSGLGGDDEPRPYDATTPLDRIVDRIPPESLASRRAQAHLAAGAPMDPWLAGWRGQRAALERHPDLLRELGDASDALVQLANVVAGESNADPAALAGPFGEYLLPVADAVARHRSKSSGSNPSASTDPRAALAAWPATTGGIESIHAGHINDSYLVDERFVLQRLNRSVFRNPEALMRNLAKALRHEGGKFLLAPIPTADGANFATDVNGEVWRLFAHLRSRSFEKLPTELLTTAGQAFGGFLETFADFADELEPVIEGFHDLEHYLARLDAARGGRDGPLMRDIDAIRSEFQPGKATRVIHGDCKVNNLLFHPTRNAVLAVIDLDTLMLGDPAWDFGDLVRSAFAGSEETETAAPFSPARFEPLCQGFFSAFGKIEDVARYAAAPAYMSFMLAARFLTDHLENDVYFKVTRHGDNLARAGSQLDLAKRFLAAEADMAAIIEACSMRPDDSRRPSGAGFPP